MKKKALLWGVPIGFINGFFASGGGIIAVLILQKFFSLEEKKAHATSIMIILPTADLRITSPQSACKVFLYSF